MDHGRRIWATAVAALVGSVLYAAPSSPLGASELDPWIDTWDRAEVLGEYQAEFDRAEPAMGFTGDVGSCSAGTTSESFRDSVFSRVNWYRRMAGLDTVTESATFSAHNQESAVMMSAEGALSHGPGAGWACYTADGAAAAGKSNLALGLSGLDAIDAYMQDFGANNTKVGHRRTMLYPQVQEMGTGDVPFGGGHWASNTLYVFDSHLWDPRPDVREERDFVSWPPSGYVPPETVWGRWSFSLARADFSSASVSITGPDGPVQVEILERIQSGGLIAPEASIVWAVDGDTNSAQLPEPTNGDECYDVTIAGVTLQGSPQSPFSYTTCVLDLDWVPTDGGGDEGGGGSSSIEPACPGLEFTAWTTPCWDGAASNGQPFVDVHSGWQQLPVAWLVANDITTGTGPSTFSPSDLVTRAQAATFIWRLAGSPAPPAGAPSFTDVTPDAYYHDAVRWMAGHGITVAAERRDAAGRLGVNGGPVPLGAGRLHRARQNRTASQHGRRHRTVYRLPCAAGH